NNLRDKEDLALVLSAFFLGFIIQSIFMVMQFYRGTALGLIGTEELQNFLAFRREGYLISRPGGTVGNVNYFARYLGFILPIASVIMITNHERKYFPLALLATIGGLLSLVIAQTRSVWGPYVVCMAIAVFLIFIRNLLTMRIIKRIVFGLLLFTLVLVFYRNLIYVRLTADDHGSANARITTSKVALNIVRDHPFIGVGANNYEFYIRKYWLGEDAFSKIAVVHNYYLLNMAQLGILGFISFLWLLIAFYVRIHRAMRSKIKYFRQIAVGIMASFICFLLAALADTYHYPILLFFFWTLAAMTEAINGLEEQYDEQVMELLSEKRYLHEL
ncbi:O-antigen ligase family protein, partial [candidate division KSB1 bacterium]|nr:O-antigen ligase family protein [candidate division KSB1 bacterium]